MAIPVFSPTVNPDWGPPKEVDPAVESLELGGGYTEKRPIANRVRRRYPLRWTDINDSAREYLEGFVEGLGGTAGPFQWISYDKQTRPAAPVLSEVAGGALPGRTCYVVTTWYDATYGETIASPMASLSVQANYFLKVEIQPIPTGVTGWRIYADTAGTADDLQTTITDGSRTWTQAGAFGSGASPPASNTLAPVRKYTLGSPLIVIPSAYGLWDCSLTLVEEWI